MSYETLISFAFATAALAISPGPDNIYVLVQSITNGVKYGMATVAGLISGCIVHTTLLAFGLSAIIKNNTSIYTAIKIFGAAYLLYLAFKVFKSHQGISLSGEAPKKSLLQLFKQGVVMNVLNPKVTIFFLAFFPGFLFSDDLSIVVQFYVLGLIFMVVSFVIFSTITMASGTIARFTVNNKRINVFFKWLQILVFVGIAVYILL
jgi:threonine/homoserine/homoserine lactone efflux protein